MAKLTLNDISAGYISITTYNGNNTLLEAALENTLSRDGTSPNAMGANLDMNSFRITNLVTAVNNSEPVTLGQANTLAGVTNPLTQNSVGAVLYPRTTGETTAGITPTALYRVPGDTRRYTNGLADALLVAAASTATIEKNIYFAVTETLAGGSEITLPAAKDDISVTAAPGAEIRYTGTGTAVTLGGAGSQTERIRWDVKIIKTNQAWDDGTDTTSVGLRCAGMKYADIVADIEGFNTGLYIYSLSGDGNVHSDYTIKLLQDNRQQLIIDRQTGGWNNSNTFHNGLITWRTGPIVTAITNSIVTKHIVQNHVSDNGNLFEEISMELVASNALPSGSLVVTVNGSYNRFMQCRIEVSDQYTDQISIGASAIYNVFDLGRTTDGITWAAFVVDASDGSNSILGFRNEFRWGAFRRHKCGAIQANGRPTGSRYDGDFAANIVGGPNTVSAADKVFAGLDGSSNVTFGVTGTGRLAIGKAPVANLGHFQFIDEAQSNKTMSWNMATWLDTTTNATASNTNFDSVTIPENSTTLVEIDFIARFADGTKVYSQKRTGIISRDGSGTAVLETDTALVTHDPDTVGGSMTGVIRVSSSQLQVRVVGLAATTINWTGIIKWQSIIAAS